MGSPLGAVKYNSLLQRAASLDRLGTTGLWHNASAMLDLLEIPTRPKIHVKNVCLCDILNVCLCDVDCVIIF